MLEDVPEGDDVETARGSLEAVEGSSVMVGDKEVTWKDLKLGDKLTFWLPERSMHVVGQPGRGKPGAPIIFKATAE